MSIDELGYEATLAALLEYVGTHILASFGDAENQWSAGSIVGTLHGGADFDLGALAPDLLGDFGGESVNFRVIDLEHPQTFGGFGIWEPGFRWGRRFHEGLTGPAIHYCVGKITVRVMPSPVKLTASK